MLFRSEIATQLVSLNEPKAEDSTIEVNLTKLYIGLKLNLTKDGEKKLDIQYPCAEFFSICKNWSEFDPSMHFIQIKNVKLYDLLSAVYIEGEQRPVKAAKRKRSLSKDVGKKKARNLESITSTS